MEEDEEGQDQMDMHQDLQGEGIDDAGEESVNNGIDSNEIVVEGQGEDDQNDIEFEEMQAQAQRQANLINMNQPTDDVEDEGE